MAIPFGDTLRICVSILIFKLVIVTFGTVRARIVSAGAPGPLHPKHKHALVYALF